MMFSKYFTLDQLTYSDTAIRKDIDNEPGIVELAYLKQLATLILDPLEEKLRTERKSSLHITSGFRCIKLNVLVGGSKTSQHTKGQAGDLQAERMTTEELYQFIKHSGIKFDQLIQEFNGWVHISFSSNNRGECLRAVKQKGKTVYLKD